MDLQKIRTNITVWIFCFEIARNAGLQFDPKVVDSFLRRWPEIEQSLARRKTVSHSGSGSNL